MQTNRILVIDANILIRAVLGKKVRELIQNHAAKVLFVTPDLCYEDALKYLPILFEKRNLPPDDALTLLSELKYLIQVVDISLYSLHEQAAKNRIAMRDLNDWSVVAVALMLDCPIWTEDNDFFGTGIATWTSDRVHLYLDAPVKLD
jgi:predicted nucleic acid-binding protein